MATGVQFIDSLRQELSAGSVTAEEALECLLPWEDDVVSRSQEELEAAWALRQEIESGTATSLHRAQPVSTADTPPSAPGPDGQAQPSATASSNGAKIEHILADLRANPLLSRDDLVAAQVSCKRLNGAAGAPGSDEAQAICRNVEDKIAQHLEAVHREIDEATHTLQGTHDLSEKLSACDKIRARLGDIELLMPDEPTLRDMIAWCDETGQELRRLLAEHDLLLADVASLCASEGATLDIGLVESSKQRLITMSDIQLSKDDTGLRRAARDLTERLDTYLSSTVQPGEESGVPEQDTLDDYEKMLRLARLAPEALSADKGKIYIEALAAARAKLTESTTGSEPQARAIPSAPPPQPKSTVGSEPPGSGSQPDGGALADGVPYHMQGAVSSQPQVQPTTGPHQVQGSTRPFAPPPPPRVQPGSISTQPVTYPPQGQQGTINPQGLNRSAPPAPYYGSTVPTHTSTMPTYGPTTGGQGFTMTPAVWIGIAAGAFVLILMLIVVIVLATSRGGTGPGGGGDSRAVAQDFVTKIANGNFDGASTLIAPEMATIITTQVMRNFVEINQQTAQGTLTSATIETLNETGDNASGTVLYNFSNGTSLRGTIDLKKVNGKWLVTSF